MNPPVSRQGRFLLKLNELIEIAGIVSAHSPNLIEGRGPLPNDALQQYQHWSKKRSSTWLDELEALPCRLVAAAVDDRHVIWNTTEGVLVDIMVGSLLARVWGSILTASGRARHNFSAERMARDAMADQDQVHQQVLKLLIEGPYLTLERAVRLDRTRRKIERWSDVLAGHLVSRYGLADFAFDPDRALDFGEEQLREQAGTRAEQLWDLYLVCLRSAFPDIELPNNADATARQELIGAILRTLPASIFLEDGPLSSVRVQRCLNGGTLREGPPGAPSPWQAPRRNGKTTTSRLRTRRNGG